MKAQEGRGTQEGLVQFGKEAWQKNIGDRSKLITRMLEVGAEKGDYSIWQAVWENLPEADPERTLLSLDAPSRQWLLQLFQDTANAAWGEKKAHKIEAEGFKKIGDKWEFDPERLQTDLFSVAEVAVGKMRELKLLPEPLAERLRQAEETKAKLFETNSWQAETIEALQKENERNREGVEVIAASEVIAKWPENLRKEEAKKRLENLPEAARTIFEKAVKIREAKFVAEDIPEIIKDLPLLEKMAVMLNVSGRVEQKIAVTTEGAHNDLLALMFPELAGFDLIAKLVRSQDGDANLLVGFSAMFPDSKKGRSSFGRRYFNLPIKVDESGALCSRLQAKDYDDLWKVLDKPAREWLEQNISKEEFLRRLKDPQKAVANNLAKLLGKRQAFLEDGSLKFAWDNKSSLLTISAQRDNRTGGVGG